MRGRLDGSEAAFFGFLRDYQALIERHVGSGYRYEYESRLYMALVHRHLEALVAALPPGARVLDLGCGRGHFAAYLQARGLRAEGVDVAMPKAGDDFLHNQNVKAVHAYKGIWKEARTRYGCICRLFNGKKLPYPTGRFDAVLFYAAYEHIPLEAVAQVTAEAVRVLKPGGRVDIYRCPSSLAWKEHVTEWLGTGAHEKRYGKAELLQRLSDAGLELAAFSRSDFWPSFVGPFQQGYNALTPALLAAEAVLRWTPMAYFFHHFEVTARKPLAPKRKG